METLLYAKDLAKEIKISERNLRAFAKKYDDFPQIRIGNRRLFVKKAVMEWFEENSTAGIRI